MVKIDHEIDARGELCPIPLLRLKKEIGKAPVGGNIRIRATDHAIKGDLAAFCSLTGQELQSCQETDGLYTLIIRRLV
jgi:tRNA 2-thiouridine synthesizing protein A